jgi:hypothetical protein
MLGSGRLSTNLRGWVSSVLRSDRPMTIEILSIDGCPNLPLALERVNAVVRNLRIKAGVQSVLMPDTSVFAGSPTVLVNREDVCPVGALAIQSAACRMYPTRNGLEGAPSVEAITKAILASA